MKKIRVVLVDDSALVRSLLAEIINRQKDMECIGTANDPLIAREMIRELNPDVLTLDVEMPRMDGIDFLGRLMRLRPMPVVMISTLTERGAEVTMRALELGAVDFVACIGSSTGGTEAIKEILTRMPADSPGIVITQHMPPGFTTSFAARLNSLCQITVQEAVHGERILPGHAYIAPGGKQFRIDRSGANYVAVVEDGEPVNRHKPSVEVLFKSCAQVVGRNAFGIMLTGMGNDGAKAMREMKDAGSYNYVQDEASCVVFGMPREAIAHGAADEVLPLTSIAPALLSRLSNTTDRYRV
ncbi:MAG: chemotaxis response regulator protein-glutamate methylesterase [Burkholderiales bacterium]|nr:chemotaxis response regulator protein-glutamate methylesterase [Burkholderiales bacterium]